MSLTRMFASWTEHLQSGASVKAVFGEPIEAAGRTLIPVAKVRYGFGAGTGKHLAEHAEGDTGPSQVEVGGGGGASAGPVGVLEVSDAGTRFIPTRSNASFYGAVAGGFLLGLWLSRRGRK